jgi:hypothetical protein
MTGLVERVARAIGLDDVMAEAALRAILETHAIVPKEPTLAMIEAIDPDYASQYFVEWYEAMLAAAPDPLKE